MAGRKQRTLEELYGITLEIPKAKVTPILQGTYCMQGPAEESFPDIETNKEAPSVDKVVLSEDVPLRAEYGLSEASVALCSSYTDSASEAASDADLKTEDGMSDESVRKKVVKRGSIGNTESPFVKSSVCDDPLHAREMNNLVSSCSSRDSFGENVDSKRNGKSSHNLSSCVIDGSKLLLTEEHTDVNHNTGCSKGEEVLAPHSVSELINGGCHHDSSSNVRCLRNNSAFTPDPEQEKKNTLESGGSAHSRVTNRSSKRLGSSNKDDQLLSEALCKGTNGKDQSLSTTVSDSNFAQSDINSHVHTGTASFECCEQVSNNHENTSQMPAIKEVDLQKNAPKTCEESHNYAEGCNSSSIVSAVVPKFSDGVDGMSSLGSTSTSDPCIESLHVVDIFRKHVNGNISDCAVKSSGMDPMGTEGSMSSVKVGVENVTFGQTSMSCSKSSDITASSGSRESEDKSKSHTKVETGDSLVGQIPPLPLTGSGTNGSKAVIKDSSSLTLKSECPPAAVKQRNPSLDRDSKLHPHAETELEKVSSPVLLVNADSGWNDIAITSQSVVKGLSTSDQLEKHTSSSGSEEKQERSLPESEHDESDLVDDVKVCDICGDAGREELLAVCSRCNDGAEHTYCMQVMLEKVPEGEWLCEGCKFKENSESQMSDKCEDPVPASKLCLNEKSKFSKGSSISKSSSKLDSKMLNLETWKANELVSTPPFSAKRLMDGSEGIPAAKRQPFDMPSSRSPRLTSIPGKPSFSRQDSFKNLDASKVNPALGRSLYSPQDCPPFPPPCSDPKMQAKLLSPRTKLSTSQKVSHFGENRSTSPSASSSLTSKFLGKSLDSPSKIANLHDGKPKSKLKQALEEVAQKQLRNRGPLFVENRKEGLVRTISKSASFKSNTSINNSNVDDLRLKPQSQNTSHAEDSKGLKRLKDGPNLIGRRNSFKLESSMNMSTTLTSNGNLSISISETKALQPDAKIKVPADATVAMKKDVGKVASYGNDGPKKLPSHGETVTSGSIQSDKSTGQIEGKGKMLKGMPVDASLQGPKKAMSSGLETSVDGSRPQMQVPSSSDDTSNMVDLTGRHEADSKEDTLHSFVVPDKVYPNSVQTLQSMGANNSEASSKEPSLFCRSRSFSINSRKIRCFKCNEVGHIAQFCSNRGNDTNARTSASASSTRNSREVTGKSKWVYAAERVLCPKTRACENDRPSIHSNGVAPPNGLNDEVVSKSLMPAAVVASDITRTANSGCGGASVLEKKVEVQEALARLVIDGGGNNLQPYLRERTSLPSSFATNFAIPAHDFIWQGGFEVRRSGKVSDICDGIQAHLSTCASPKVLEAANRFPSKVQLEEISRLSSWPVQFRVKYPTEDNIALYFFAKDVMSYERYYKKLLENMLRNDLALKANLDGVELLIFTSNQLPDKSQRWNRLYFLWGVFREQKGGCAETVAGKLDTCSSCQDLPSSVISETSVARSPPVQLGKALSSSDRMSGVTEATKAGGPEYLMTTAPQQNAHTQLNSGVMNSSDSCKFKHYVPNKSVPVEKQSASLAPDISPTGAFAIDCHISTNSSAAPPERDDQRCSSMKDSDISLNEEYENFGSRSLVKPSCTQPSVTESCTSIVGTMPIVLGRQEMSPAASQYANCREDIEELSKGKPNIVFKVVEGYGEELGSIGKGKSPVLVNLDDDRPGMVPIDEEKRELDFRSNNKRPYSLQKAFSAENGTLAERSEGYNSANEDQDYKRMKTGNIVNVDDRVPSRAYQICDLNSSFSENEDTKADGFFYDRVTKNPSKPTEKGFFSVDFGYARECQASSSNTCTGVSSNSSGCQGPDLPNLELALGAGTRSSRKGLLTLFGEDNHSGAGADKTDDGEVDDNGAPSSLSLSLTFPMSVKDISKKQDAESEKLLTKRPHVNTSLLLFGGCTDS